jgi:hypothetical protein
VTVNTHIFFWPNSVLKINFREIEGAIKNPETLATFGTEDKDRQSKKHNTEN